MNIKFEIKNVYIIVSYINLLCSLLTLPQPPIYIILKQFTYIVYILMITINYFSITQNYKM